MYGEISSTHETVPTPTAIIRESSRLDRSRPGVRARIIIIMPAIRQG